MTNETMLKKYVVTVRGTTCDANGKDAMSFPDKAKLYGDVEDYDVNMTALKAAYNSEYNELKARYDAVKSLNLSPDEITFLNLYRKLKAETAAVHVAEKEALAKQLADVKAEQEGRIAKIAAILASASDAVR